MKYRLAPLALVFATTAALAHPGGLDSKGGHKDAQTGKYHLHKAPEPKKPEAKKPESKKPEVKKTEAKKKK